MRSIRTIVSLFLLSTLVAFAAPSAAATSRPVAVTHITAPTPRLLAPWLVQVELAKRVAYQEQRRDTVMAVTGLPYPVADTLIRLSDRYNLSVTDVVTIIAKETGDTFRSDLTNHNSDGTADHGLMQLNDGGTLQWLAEKVGLDNPDPYDPQQNLQMGIWYLYHLNAACRGDWDCVASRYNGDSTGSYARHVAELSRSMSTRLREAWNQTAHR